LVNCLCLMGWQMIASAGLGVDSMKRQQADGAAGDTQQRYQQLQVPEGVSTAGRADWRAKVIM
jgi:hypothetical protein